MVYSEGEDAQEEGAQHRTAFREAEKKYQLFREQQMKIKGGKRRAGKLVTRPIDMGDVLDLKGDAGDVTREGVDRHHVPGFDGPVFTFTRHPGLVFLPGALSPAEAAELTRAALTDYPEPPARTNHSLQYGPVAGLWEAAQRGLRLRWTRRDDPHAGPSRRVGCEHRPPKPHLFPDSADPGAQQPQQQQPQQQHQQHQLEQLRHHADGQQADQRPSAEHGRGARDSDISGSTLGSSGGGSGPGRQAAAATDGLLAAAGNAPSGSRAGEEGTRQGLGISGRPHGCASGQQGAARPTGRDNVCADQSGGGESARLAGGDAGGRCDTHLAGAPDARDGPGPGPGANGGGEGECAGGGGSGGGAAASAGGRRCGASGPASAAPSPEAAGGAGACGSQVADALQSQGGQQLGGEQRHQLRAQSPCRRRGGGAGALHAGAAAAPPPPAVPAATAPAETAPAAQSAHCAGATTERGGRCGDGSGAAAASSGSGGGDVPSAEECWSADGPGPPAEQLLRKLRWATLGPQFVWTQRRYDFAGSYRPLPPLLQSLALRLAGVLDSLRDAGLHLAPEAGGVCGGYRPDAAIVNFYQQGDMLGGHLDDVERDMGQPIVSLSLGCPAVFLMGGTTKDVAPTALLLRGGDALVLAGEARRCYHGVPRILEMEGAGPSGRGPGRGQQQPCVDRVEAYIRCARINISIRAVR